MIKAMPQQVSLAQGVVRVTGKGGRERLVPLGEEAVSWLRDFSQGPRQNLLHERFSDFLFPTSRSNCMTRQAFWQLIKRYALEAGIGKS